MKSVQQFFLKADSLEVEKHVCRIICERLGVGSTQQIVHAGQLQKRHKQILIVTQVVNYTKKKGNKY